MIQWAAQVDQLAFTIIWRGNTRHQRCIRQPRRYAPGNIRRRGAFGDILDAAIRQRDVNLFHVRVHLGRRNNKLIGGLPSGQGAAGRDALWNSYNSKVQRPPAMVRSTGMVTSVEGFSFKGSRPRTTRSASFPVSMEPFRFSS